jgi:hypothetical protein
MTVSEELFEKFCAQRGIAVERVAESTQRSPDYEIDLSGTTVVVEVKEISAGLEERQAIEALGRGEAVVRNIKPGEKVRRKISAQSGQIRSRTQGCKAGLLVLFDRGLTIRHLDPYQIRVAMEGFDTLVLSVPKDPRRAVRTIAEKAGPRKKLTASDNTSISALGVLSVNEHDRPELVIYHNRHAEVPLPAAALAQFGIQQFRLSNGPEGALLDWLSI